MGIKNKKNKMNHGSLFSGIGGFDLAAEWAGWNNLFHCEINEFGQKILKYYWPKSITYADIKTTDFTIHRGTIDVLTGGFPCQPYSLAGKRKGKDDERHLWPEMLRAIREIQPRYIVGENVYGIVNWNGGVVFDEVQADLENEGYEIIPVVLPACAVNAPHRRDRVWFVANSVGNTKGSSRTSGGIKSIGRNDYKQPEERGEQAEQHNGCSSILRNITNTACIGQSGEKHGRSGAGFGGENSEKLNWNNFPTQSPVCGRNDGLPERLDGITFPKWRNESIKAYGNAIVPQVAFEIFKVINQIENDKI